MCDCVWLREPKELWTLLWMACHDRLVLEGS